MSVHADATAFIKQMLEFDGSIRVTDDGYLLWREDNAPIKLEINHKQIVARIYQANMSAGEFTVINPFFEPLGTSCERVWFFALLNSNVSNMITRMITKLAEMVINKQDIDYDKLDMIQPYLDSFDEKFLKEVKQIGACNIIRMHYFKKTHVASLGSDLWDEEFRKQHKSIRKRTWDALTGLLEVFLGTDKLESYDYKATIVCMQETDARLHLFANILETVHEYLALILNMKIDMVSFMNHMQRLKEYHDATAWLVSSTTKPAQQPVKTVPWQAASVVQPSYLPQNGSPFSGCKPATQVQQVYGVSQPSYGAPQMYGAPQNYNNTQIYGTPPVYGAPQQHPQWSVPQSSPVVIPQLQPAVDAPSPIVIPKISCNL